MYKNNFAVALKVNGEVLRETNQTVHLPFGSEYSVLLKNLNSVKAQARISIDGVDVTNWIVIYPNSSVDIERYVRNLEKGNRFKFIERTEDIEEYRGVKIEDGLVRVEYKFEKAKPVHVPVVYDYTYWPYQSSSQYDILRGGYNSSSGSRTSGRRSLGDCRLAMFTANCLNTTTTSSLNDNGITVPGSESSQRFYNVSDFECNPSEVITLSVKGYNGAVKIEKPVTVYYRPTCTTCGKTNKATNKFCSNCGTALSII